MFEDFKIIRNAEYTPKVGVVVSGWTGKYKGELYGNYNKVEIPDDIYIQNAQETYNALITKEHAKEENSAPRS